MPLDKAFWPALWDAALASGTRPEVLLAVWYSESSLDPTAESSIGCLGLNQSCPKPYGPGFPNDDAAAYKAAPASAQVAWIKPQLLHLVALNRGPFYSAARYRQANFLPATLAVAKAPGDVVAGASGPYALAYTTNKGLDVRGAGVVTVADLGLGLEQLIARSGAPLHAAIATAYERRPDGAPWSSPQLVLYEPGGRGRAPIVLALVGLGLGALVVAHRGARA